MQIGGRLLRSDGRAGCQQNVAGVHAGVHHHGGDAGFAIPVDDGPLDGGRTAIARQQRGVHVDGTPAGDVQQALGQQLAEGHHHEKVRCQARHLLRKRIVAHCLGLKHGISVDHCGSLYRAGRQLAPASFGAVRLGDHGQHGVALCVQGRKRRHGELRRAHEDDFQWGTHRCFNSFLTRRLYIWRLRALMRSMNKVPSRWSSSC